MDIETAGSTYLQEVIHIKSNPHVTLRTTLQLYFLLTTKTIYSYEGTLYIEITERDSIR
jgi:hypothetical protein